MNKYAKFHELRPDISFPPSYLDKIEETDSNNHPLALYEKNL